VIIISAHWRSSFCMSSISCHISCSFCQIVQWKHVSHVTYCGMMNIWAVNSIVWYIEHEGSQVAYDGIINVRAVRRHIVLWWTWGQSDGILCCDEHEGSQMAYCGILNVRAVTKSTDVSSCQNILWLFPIDVLAIDIFDYLLFWNFSLILQDLLNKLWNAPKLLRWIGFWLSPCCQRIDIQISENICNICVGFSTKSHSM
jgi:hypothetical protein